MLLLNVLLQYHYLAYVLCIYVSNVVLKLNVHVILMQGQKKQCSSQIKKCDPISLNPNDQISKAIYGYRYI